MDDEIHWHDGQFLAPQHFEAAFRRQAALAARSESWSLTHSHGVRALEFDTEALTQSRFVVTRCLARLRDGTQVVIPEEALVEEVDLRPALRASGSAVTVSLAVPKPDPGRRNASRTGEGVRYRIESKTLKDLETGEYEAPSQVLRLRPRLVLEGAEQTGLETLPLARVEAGAPPRLAPGFLPPLLTIDAWPPLARRLVNLAQAAADRLDELAGPLADRATLPNDSATFEALLKVDGLNRAVAGLSALRSTPGVAPAAAYAELLAALGSLAMLLPSRRVPSAPPYDHDDLGRSLLVPIRMIEQALRLTSPTDHRKLDLSRDVDDPAALFPPRVSADLRPLWEEGWIDEDRAFYLVVRTGLTKSECGHALRNELDISIGAREEVEANFRNRNPGLELFLLEEAPRGLPSGAGLVHFRFKRETESKSWSNTWEGVVRTKQLAIRLNHERSEFRKDQPADRIFVKHRDPRKNWFEFAVYALPPH